MFLVTSVTTLRERSAFQPKSPATASNTHRDQCMEAGMDDFMAKPYTRVELAAMLERWAGTDLHAVTAATR